nr:uncharacterized protein LOC119627231 isoform X2 [Chlorocebus sabaeus]
MEGSRKGRNHAARLPPARPTDFRGPCRRCFCCCSVAGGAIDTAGASTRPLPPLPQPSPDFVELKKKWNEGANLWSHKLQGKENPQEELPLYLMPPT